MEEHERDIRLFKDNTALAQLNKKVEIDIDFQNSKRLANYVKQSCTLYRETIEIKTHNDACNTRQHAQEEGWIHMVHRGVERRRSPVFIFELKTAEMFQQELVL